MKCPYCKNEDTVTYYKADMPNILSACPESMLKKVKTFSFEAMLCRNCLLGFNATILPDNELKMIYDNYLYISPMRGIGHTKYEGMVNTLKKYYSKDDDLLEIGCSEGYLLNMLKMEGYLKLTGIEPGPQADQARELGLNVIKGYFGESTSSGKTIDGFFMMHVFEHFDNPFLILEAIKKQLAPRGKIIIEVPNFGGYNHQHLFFYSLPFMMRLCREKGLKIIECYNGADILRIIIVHKDNDQYNEILFSEKPGDFIGSAKKKYEYFTEVVSKLTRLFKNNINKAVYWWGAGSASVMFMNQIDGNALANSNLTVIDGDENKWGMYIPKVNVEVRPYTILENKSVDVLVIASQFHNEIMESLKKRNIHARHIEIIV